MAMIQRFGILPMFLFSGTFFPLETAALVPAADRLDLAAVARHASWAGSRATACEEPALAHRASTSPTSRLICLVGWRWTQRIVTRRLDK